jgi:hypothetical protein
MGRSPLRFENLKGLEPAWARAWTLPEILIALVVLFGIGYLIYELKQ